jgi:hypothetical protein
MIMSDHARWLLFATMLIVLAFLVALLIVQVDIAHGQAAGLRITYYPQGRLP